MGNDLIEPLRLRPLIERRPWWSLGVATVAGFAAGIGLGFRKKAAPAAGGKVHELFATANRRLRRVVRSALGAIVVANLRGNVHATDVPTDGASAMETDPQPSSAAE